MAITRAARDKETTENSTKVKQWERMPLSTRSKFRAPDGLPQGARSGSPSGAKFHHRWQKVTKGQCPGQSTSDESSKDKSSSDSGGDDDNSKDGSSSNQPETISAPDASWMVVSDHSENSSLDRNRKPDTPADLDASVGWSNVTLG